MQALASGIDHVFAPVRDGAAVFRVLVDDLGLPTAWPFLDYGGFSSGGVCLGDVNLEILQSSDTFPWFRSRSPARIQGLAFTPARPIDEDFAAEVRARGLGCSPPMPHDGELMGVSGPVWTNLGLEGFIADDSLAFFCEYHMPAAADLGMRRAALDAAAGGRLGVTGVAEVVLTSPDPDAARARWARLLGPEASRGWRPPHGPGLRVEAGEFDRVETLVLAVREPAEAQKVFERAAPGLEGLSFVFTQH